MSLPSCVRRTLPSILVAALGLASCRAADPASTSADLPAASAQGPGDIVLARVDGVPLSLSDAMASFEDSHGGHSVLMRGEPAVRELAGRIIERQLFLAEALALELDRDPRVQDAIEERRQLLAERLFWERALAEGIEVSEEEVEAFYGRTEVMLAVTLVETEERARCEALRQRVLGGASIAEIAAGESIHPSRNSGGLIPIVRRGDLEPALDEAVFALAEERALTEVVATQGGWAFARLDQRTINENRPSREVMLPQIRKVLADRAEEALRVEVDARVRAAAGEQIDEQLTALAVVLDTNRDPATVVARAAGQELTLGEVQEYLDLDKLRAAPSDKAAEAVQGIVREWTGRKAVRQAAREQGLFEDPEVLPEVESWRKDLLLAVLNQEYVYAGLVARDEDVRAHYEEHLDDAFTLPGEARVAYLIVPTREAAEEALRRLGEGAEFGDVARAVSTDGRAQAHGGRIGWIQEGQLLEAVEAEVFAAQPGTVVGPIETEEGFFVVDVMERRARTPLPFELSAPRARRAVERDLRLAAYDTWVQRLRERADVEVDEAGIARAVAWLEQENQRREAEKAAQPPRDTPHGAPLPPDPGPEASAPPAPSEELDR